jgi:hypothetical protein
MRSFYGTFWSLSANKMIKLRSQMIFRVFFQCQLLGILSKVSMMLKGQKTIASSHLTRPSWERVKGFYSICPGLIYLWQVFFGPRSRPTLFYGPGGLYTELQTWRIESCRFLDFGIRRFDVNTVHIPMFPTRSRLSSPLSRRVSSGSVSSAPPSTSTPVPHLVCLQMTPRAAPLQLSYRKQGALVSNTFE